MLSPRSIRSALVCTAAMIALWAAPAAAQRRALFSADPGVEAASRPAATRARAVRRSRATDVDLTMLTAAGTAAPRGFAAPVIAAAPSVVLNLFQNADYVAALDHIETVSHSSYAWVGDVIGEPGSQVVLAVTDGTFAGKVAVGDASYSIVPDGSGGYTINDIDRSQLPPMDPGGVVRSGGRAERPAPAAVSPASAETGDVFDLLILYTTAAKNAAGGTSAMNAHITLAIADMNSAYTNSAIAVRARLAAAVEFAHADTGNVHTDLDALEHSAAAAALRNQYAADLVAMIVGREDPCCSGLADIKGTTDQLSVDDAFSVEIFYSSVAGIYSLTHEVGHNQGADHERANGCLGLFSYSCGYVDIAHRFYDLMSYGINCSSCTQINYFSNPLVNYNGFPTGTTTEDNARTLNNTRVSVANYRVFGATPLGPPTNLTASASGNSVTLSWAAPASGTPTSYVIEAGTGPGRLDLANFNTGSPAPTFSASGVGSGSYYVRVRATDGVSVSAVSNEVVLVVTGGCLAPAAPAYLSSSVVGSTVTLSWNASPIATSYVVEAGTTPFSTNAAVVDAGASTSLVATGVGRGTYYVRVRAKNSCGTSVPSNEDTVIVR